MDARTALREVKNGQPLPVYVCYGQEGYLMQQFLSSVTEHCIGPDVRDLALSKYDLQSTPLAEVLDDAETAPFMVPRKLIIANNATFFTGAKDKSRTEHDIGRLQQYLNSPSEDTILLFTVQADKLDERKKIVKQARLQEALIEFQPMDENALIRWIAAQAQKNEVTIKEEAARKIMFNTGAHLQQIAGELNKCCSYAGQGGEITVEVVDELVPRTVEQNIFLLIDDIVRHKHDQALTLLYDLLGQREEPIKITSLIARQFRIVLQAKSLGDKSFTDRQIGAELGIHPYAAKLAYEQSRHYNENQLSRILDELAELDYKMKTGAIHKVMGLEMFILGLAAAKV